MELFTGKGDDVLRVADQLLVLTLAKSHYERLGVARSADVETIHLAFRRRSKVLRGGQSYCWSFLAAKAFRDSRFSCVVDYAIASVLRMR